MKIIVSVTDTRDIGEAEQHGADMVELRLDLMKGSPGQFWRKNCRIPVILTLRSRDEGGQFTGDGGRWFEFISSIARSGDWIDIEARYRQYADTLREKGCTIIASCHRKEMPSIGRLTEIEEVLRNYGDIPKIVVTPSSDRDVIDLFLFTHSSQKPICVGVMGDAFRYARAVLPLFGSSLVYCHIGRPTAEGQYHIDDQRTIASLLMPIPPLR